jgi:Holliday junction resolvase RusA-like endonuclease
MLCDIGRVYDPKHATCRTCPEQSDACRRGAKKQRRAAVEKERSSFTASPVIIDGAKAIIVTGKDLRTPNDWTNKKNGQRVYVRERKEWERLLSGVIFWWGHQRNGVKRRLSITRYVARADHLMKDRTNLEGACKPLEDALKLAGVIIDDNQKYLLRDTPHQDIGDPRIIISLEDMEGA